MLKKRISAHIKKQRDRQMKKTEEKYKENVF